MKQHILIRGAALVLCLVLLTSCLVSGMLARFAAGGSTLAKARTAAFGELTLTLPEKEAWQLIPGVEIAMAPTVSMGKSEVAVAVYVDVTPKTAGIWTWNDGEKKFTTQNGLLSWTVAKEWGTPSEKDGTFTFCRQLAPGDELTGAGIVEGGKITVSKDIDYDEYYETVKGDDLEIGFQVRAVQLD